MATSCHVVPESLASAPVPADVAQAEAIAAQAIRVQGRRMGWIADNSRSERQISSASAVQNPRAKLIWSRLWYTRARTMAFGLT